MNKVGADTFARASVTLKAVYLLEILEYFVLGNSGVHKTRLKHTFGLARGVGGVRLNRAV